MFSISASETRSFGSVLSESAGSLSDESLLDSVMLCGICAGVELFGLVSGGCTFALFVVDFWLEFGPEIVAEACPALRLIGVGCGAAVAGALRL